MKSADETAAGICATNPDLPSGLDLTESDGATPGDLVAALHRHKWSMVSVTHHEIRHLEAMGLALKLYSVVKTRSSDFVAEFAERMQIAVPSGSDSAALCLKVFIDYAGASFPASRDSGGLRYLSAKGVEPSSVVAPKVPRSQHKKESKSAKQDTITKKLARLGETDADNARRLVERYRHKLMWTPGLGWLVYDGKRWVPDEQSKRLLLAVSVATAIKDETKYLTDRGDQDVRLKFSKATKNKPQIDRMLELAKPHLSVDDDRLDRDPWLFNVANGTIDLKTGILERHDRRDLTTKIAHVAYSPKSKCTRFKRFIRQVTGGDKQFARYVKKAIGYSLTGLAIEQVLFFLWGGTRTGKSTLLNLIRDTLGDYGKHTPTDILLVKRFDNAIPVAEARLKGARMVTAIEANHNQQLDEAKLKAMTGGDKVTARFMRQNLFEYQPEFKLWFAINDLPRVRVTDDAIWRRIVVLPFKARIDPANIDKYLPDKLRKEASGILAWAVRGALLWAEEGFSELALIESTKNAWRKRADTIKLFFHECCHHAELKHKIRSSVLFNRYTEWCAVNGEQPCSTNMFKARLIELNLTYKRLNNGSNWLGVKLVA